ncbi:MAG: Methyltransferase type 11 [Marmoricola sp.]|nr:Methyltransferase type 11 [Marmoricola sp.]
MSAAVPPVVDAIRVDKSGFSFAAPAVDDVVDVRFDGRRVWSFWLLRDSRPVDGQRFVPWPGALKQFLNGVTQLAIVSHVTETVLYEAELTFGTKTDRIAVVNAAGAPLGLDKTNKLMLTFDTRTAEHVKPLLDSMESVLAALKEAGIEAFVVYGSLLGAVRGGKLIGHDSDADLGYVSRHTHPVEVQVESFRIQRRLRDLGYESFRYSGFAFRIDVYESDGSRRGLDLFGGFIAPAVGSTPAMLYMMGEVGAPFELDWIYPLSEVQLEGRTLAAPRRPEKLLEAMYGSGWKVPDPAYKFTTPRTTERRLTGWFRGIRLLRQDWVSRYKVRTPPRTEPSVLAQLVVEHEGAVPARVVELGTGRGEDALWLARQGAEVRALDFVVFPSAPVRDAAAAEGLALEVGNLNLNSIRSWMVEAAHLSHTFVPQVVLARHLIDAASPAARRAAWRLCDLALRGGGRLYLEFYTGGEREQLVRPIAAAKVIDELAAYGAVIVHREDLIEQTASGEPGRPTTRLVAQWQA